MYCLRPQKIVNKYNGMPLTVSCRNCECCVVERANSISQRIINHINFSYGLNTYFVTLTYSDEYIPNVRLDDCECGIPVIYRGRTNDVLDYSAKDIRKYEYVEDNVSSRLDAAFLLPGYNRRAIGVLWYQDHTLFMKRLLKFFRTRGIKPDLSFFCSAEYGETTYRPHFHYLFTTSVSLEVFKAAVMSAWTYCDYDRISCKWFELAYSPAQYLGTYVCDGYNLPLFYKLPLWRQKKFHSLFYGFNNPAFELSAFFDSASKRVTTYHTEYVSKEGAYLSYDLPIPNYVRNRYFPPFKGFTRLNVHDFIHFVSSLDRYSARTFESFNVFNSKNQLISIPLCTYDSSLLRILDTLGYNCDDIDKAWLAFQRIKYFADVLEVSLSFYCQIYYDYYQAQQSYYLKSVHEDDQSFLHSFRFYQDISDNLNPIVFTDSYGVNRKDDIFRYVSVYQPERKLQLLDKFSNNKNLKKIKFKTQSYYNIAYGT